MRASRRMPRPVACTTSWIATSTDWVVSVRSWKHFKTPVIGTVAGPRTHSQACAHNQEARRNKHDASPFESIIADLEIIRGGSVLRALMEQASILLPDGQYCSNQMRRLSSTQSSVSHPDRRKKSHVVKAPDMDSPRLRALAQLKPPPEDAKLGSEDFHGCG